MYVSDGGAKRPCLRRAYLACQFFIPSQRTQDMEYVQQYTGHTHNGETQPAEAGRTLVELARHMAAHFTTAKRVNGDTFAKLIADSPEWMTGVIRAAHDDGRILPDDDIYRQIQAAIDAFSEQDDDASDKDLIERTQEEEPDCDTHALTAWLHGDVRRVSYLDELEISAHMTGVDMLMAAQKLWIEEIWRATLNALVEVEIEQEAA